MKRKLRRIKIGGFEYDVLWDYRYTETCHSQAQCDHTSLKIKIKDTDSGGQNAHGLVEKQFFWHELIHAMGNAYNIDKLFDSGADEVLIESLSRALLDLFENNPRILEELNGIEK